MSWTAVVITNTAALGMHCHPRWRWATPMSKAKPKKRPITLVHHHTGDIRDFICDSCDTGLGRFKNGKDCLKDALVYLEEREAR